MHQQNGQQQMTAIDLEQHQALEAQPSGRKLGIIIKERICKFKEI